VTGARTCAGAAAIFVLSVLPTPLVERVGTQEAAARVYGLEDVDRLPRMTEVRQPPLSRRARETGLDGTVIVEGVVATNGRVAPSSVRVVKTLHPLLDEAAVRALLASWFSPAFRAGRPVPVTMEIPYTFRLAGRAPVDQHPPTGSHAPVGLYATFDVVYTTAGSDSTARPAFVQLWRRSRPDEDHRDLDTFSPADTLIAEVALPGAPPGTPATGRWLYTERDSEKPIVESELRTEREGDEAIFKAWMPEPWPEGAYAFETSVDGHPGPRVRFRVTR
jgi:TonB family protein